MPRPTSKAELLQQSVATRDKLLHALDGLPAATRATAYQADIDNQSRSARDVLAHLHAWHRLLLGWYDEGMAGGKPAMPAAGYNWRQTPELNHDLWEEFRDISYDEVMHLFEATHVRVTDLIERHDDAELFTKHHYPWTGGTTLGSLLTSVTSSHYEWGVRTLRDIRRTL